MLEIFLKRRDQIACERQEKGEIPGGEISMVKRVR